MKRGKYLATVSTDVPDLIVLLDRLKKTKRLGMFISAALEAFIRSNDGQKMAAIFNPESDLAEGGGSFDEEKSPLTESRVEEKRHVLPVSESVCGEGEPLVENMGRGPAAGVNIDFDAVFRASA